MFSLTIKKLAEISGGHIVHGDLSKYGDTVINNIAIDSRKINNRSVFACIIGEKTDAHIFLNEVLKTSYAAFITRDVDYSGDRVLIKVDNITDTVQAVGRYYRELITRPVVAVTGSTGKTSTRNMISTALEAGGKVFSTKGNSNSQLGVPLTLLNFDDDSYIGVLEAGISMPGEMELLSPLIRPDTVVVTNIGITHIENLKTRENILKEKMHICDCMNEDGVLILNGDNDLLCSYESNIKIWHYGLNGNSDIFATNISYENGKPCFTAHIFEKSVSVKLSVYGEHNIYNSLAALACAYRYNADLDKAAERLEKFTGSDHRQQIINSPKGYVIIDDSYNANPDSMKAGLDTLASFKDCSRRIAVLADMAELGDKAEESHAEIGKYIKNIKNITALFTYGELSKLINYNCNVDEKYHYNTKDELDRALISYLKKGDAVLVKGSNSMRLTDTCTLIL